MKSENKEVSIEILDRLADYGVFVSNNAPPLNRQKALVILGEVMLTCFFEEFSGLWRELFPNCRLQDFEASEKEKQHILGEQDADQDRNSTPTEEDEAGIEYWDLIAQKPERKTARAGYQLISDLWKNRSVEYLPGKKKGSNYKQKRHQNKHQLLSGHAGYYQPHKQLKSYIPDRLVFPKWYHGYSKLSEKTGYSDRKMKIMPLFKMPEAVSHSMLGHSRSVYKSLESYLNNYKGA